MITLYFRSQKTLQENEKDDDFSRLELDEDDSDSYTTHSSQTRFDTNTSVPPTSHLQVSSTLPTLQTNLLEKLKTEEEDADKYFLLSLLPDFKKLNDEEKLDFRLHCLQFFLDTRKKYK